VPKHNTAFVNTVWQFGFKQRSLTGSELIQESINSLDTEPPVEITQLVDANTQCIKNALGIIKQIDDESKDIVLAIDTFYQKLLSDNPVTASKMDNEPEVDSFNHLDWELAKRTFGDSVSLLEDVHAWATLPKEHIIGLQSMDLISRKLPLVRSNNPIKFQNVELDKTQSSRLVEKLQNGTYLSSKNTKKYLDMLCQDYPARLLCNSIVNRVLNTQTWVENVNVFNETISELWPICQKVITGVDELSKTTSASIVNNADIIMHYLQYAATYIHLLREKKSHILITNQNQVNPDAYYRYINLGGTDIHLRHHLHATGNVGWDGVPLDTVVKMAENIKKYAEATLAADETIYHKLSDAALEQAVRFELSKVTKDSQLIGRACRDLFVNKLNMTETIQRLIIKDRHNNKPVDHIYSNICDEYHQLTKQKETPSSGEIRACEIKAISKFLCDAMLPKLTELQ
jgi:hypothetical protein